MAININYSPVGLAGLLAVQSGEAEARQRGAAVDLQIIGLAQSAQAEANRVAAQNKAFELQSAMADRQHVNEMNTPAADHIAERADLARADRTANQKLYKTQLDTMLQAGTIDPGQYQKGLLAVMTGNEGLMQSILATPKAVTEKPNISNAEEVDLIRGPFREKRRGMEAQLQKVQASLADPFTAMLGEKATSALNTQATTLQGQIDELFAQETAALDQWRTSGRKGAVAEGVPTGGSATVTYRRTPKNASEQNILNILKSQGITMPSWTPKTTTISPQGETAPTGKSLDADTAKAILQEAGGDKDRAREIARSRGYIL